MNKTLGVLLFSAIEVTALVIWLALQDMQVGAYDVLGLLGIVILFAGLFVEHVVTDNVLHRRPLFNIVYGDKQGLGSFPLGQIAIFSAIETGIWVAWLLLYDGVDPGIAVVFLVAALFIEHSISKNVHERRPIFSALHATVIPHTLVETAACHIWLVLVRSAQLVLGPVVLLVGSIIEHLIAVRGTEVD